MASSSAAGASPPSWISRPSRPTSSSAFPAKPTRTSRPPARSCAVGFAKVHIFSYSPRQGTPAAELRETVPPTVVARRREHLRRLEEQLAADYRRRLLGRRLDVLVEGSDPQRPGHVRGTSCRAVQVSFPGFAPALLRRCVPVRAVATAEGVLLGEPEPEAGEHTRSLPLARPGRFQLPIV